MNWDEITGNSSRNGFLIGEVMEHYQKLGIFRRQHPSVGAGKHQMISSEPYVFSRAYSHEEYSDQVLCGLELGTGIKSLKVNGLFEEGSELYDYYSGNSVRVEKGQVTVDSEFEIVLLGQR